MAQSAKPLVLGLGSSQDLRVLRSTPTLGSELSVSALAFLSPSLSLPQVNL